MYSCSGSDAMGIVYGLGAVFIYSILLKLIYALHSSGNKSTVFWKIGGVPLGFFYYLVLILIFLSFFVGKLN